MLFADLVGYTTLSESRDPEQVKNLVDTCFERLVSDIDAFGGRVDKIIGDAIVALFGAPVAHEDDAERAVRAALRMQHTLERAATELGVSVRMRIGVNTGEVLVGALRAGGDYTAMGDVVNTANRMQTAAEPGSVLVGASTYAATRRVVRYESLDAINAKGREEPVAVWRAVDALAPPGYRPERNRAALIGREAELGLLQHSVDNAVRNERAALLLVLGEAGVGKSRLAEELAERAACEHDALVLEGRCVPYGEANVWWPVADALRHGCGISSSDPADIACELARASVLIALGEEAAPAEVERVHQGLLHLMGYDSTLRGIDPSRARDEAIAAVVTYAEQYSTQRPVVVVLSDLHWADDLVLQLVDTLLERLAGRRFVVLATARPVVEERWHPPHGRHNLVVLTLDSLTPDSAAELLAELAGADLGEELAAALLARSGGNPFFLEELVTLLVDAGMVGADDASRPGVELVELPDTLRGLVAARLDGLNADERRVLDDCAVLGRRGTIHAIEVMSTKHLGIKDVRPVLESLEAKELLVLSGAGDAAKWSFRSDLVREVAYGTLTKADRARSHQGIAEWMEGHEDTTHDAVVDRITYNYVRAAELAHELGAVDGLCDDLVERALTWLERAAGRATQADIPVVAERLYGEGLRLLAGHHGPAHRAFLTGRARALAGLRELAPARNDVLAAIDESRAVGAAGEADLGRALLVLADIEQKEAAWDAAEGALSEARDVFARIGDPSGEAEVLRLRGFGALFRHEYEAATELLEQALARFELLGDERGVAWALQNLAWCAFYSGHAEEAEARLRLAAATFEAIGDKGGLRWARGLLAWTRFQQGHAAEAGELAEEILRVDRRSFDRWALGMMLVLAGSVRLWTGRTLSAIERLEEARDLFEGIDDEFGFAQTSAVLGRALVMAGRIDEGLAMVAPVGLPGGAQLTDRMLLVAIMAGLAASVQVGDIERSEAMLDTSPVPVEGVGSDGDLIVGDTERLTSLALHRLQSGDLPAALELLEGLRKRIAPEIDPNSHSALALAHVADGALDDALAEAEEVDVHARASYLDRLMAGVARGLALARRGERAASIAVIDQVRAAADATEDVLSQALVRLADATAASARGEADAAERRAEADARLAELGLLDTGWRQAFSLALGVSSAT